MTPAIATPRAASSPIPVHIRVYGTRPACARDPEPHWTPVRYVRVAQVCSFCGHTIPAGSPGSTTGTRGTKAYYNAVLNVWECIGCRQEALRALGAQLEMDNPRRVA